MKSLEEYKNNTDILKFVTKLFEAKQVSHVYHLRNKSFAEHNAFQSFYESFHDLIDDFIEVYQGQYGILNFETTMQVEYKDNPIKYYTELLETIKDNYKIIKESHLKNMLDEMIATVYKLIYKLKYLK